MTANAPTHTPAELPPLDVAKTFHEKTILLIGTTGFVGKVVLSMLLQRYPGVGRVYCLVRPGMGNTAEERFFTKVAASPAFDPLRQTWGDGYQSFMREKIVPIPGDIGRPLCNFGDDQFQAFAETGLDAIINSAGLVSFTPSLESAIRINAMGARNVLEVARRSGAHMLHVSTCYVAGRRDGDVWEDEPVVGYFPRKHDVNTRDFSAEAEIADCQRIIEQVREMANDRAHVSQFREQAAESLREQRRNPDDESTLRLSVARERKIWVARRLVELGQERAEHWGFTNTYTYTKSLGEQVILGDKEVRATIVRPAIVESALRYPFAGWNEGFNTTAPLVYLMLKGHRQVVSGHRTAMDIVPVDLVAAGIIQATAALLANRHKAVYQCGTSDINPVFTSRLAELTSLAVRRYYRDKADNGENVLENRIRARLESFPVSYRRFQRTSAPQIKRVALALQREIDGRLPRWGAPRLTAMAERAKDELGRVSDFTGQVTELIDLFKAFTHDHDIRFRCDNTRALSAQLTIGDQQALPWDPEKIDWRKYWFDSHFPGLQKWVFPVLDDEFGPKQRSVYTYKDLLELFDAATKLNKHRVALRLLPGKDEEGEDAEPVVYSYERVQDMAVQGAVGLRERRVEPGDRVMLMSENRPEWGICYFAILKAGATAVPLDSQLALAEVENLARASGARVLIVSARVADRLLSDEGMAVPVAAGSLDVDEAQLMASLGAALARTGTAMEGKGEAGEAGQAGQAGTLVQVMGFDDVLVEPRATAMAVTPPQRGDNVASLIFTSGTTGEPKGVMLTHKNFTAMTSRLSSVFKLYRHDGVLSVLPLHHTFEFSTSFLMPLVHGSSITYLDEIDADSLSRAFEDGTITHMAGVPALWQLLHRKMFKPASERGPLVLRAFESMVELSRQLWRTTGVNVGRLAFFPVHRKLGGRLRLLMSGGSALPPDVMKAFHGLGFRLYEGYGMTEAAPVITMQRPDEKPVVGSVGRAMPGMDVKIHEPDAGGVGEIIARGPNVMAGYYKNPDATAEVLKNGWLHTGDLGRMDEDGTIYIVGRKKEMILGASGENVYPDELEEIYRDSPYIKELSIVGLPAEGGGETVAALVVPEYDQSGQSGQDSQDGQDGPSGPSGYVRETVRERVREHMARISAQLPLYKRVRVFHLWDMDLPKTSTRKVKRRDVLGELVRLERAAAGMARLRKERDAEPKGDGGQGDQGGRGGAWVRDVIAQVAQKKRGQIQAETRLDSLGFDSLMFTELGVALEAAGVVLPNPAALAELDTVADVERFLGKQEREQSKPVRGGARPRTIPRTTKNDERAGDEDDIHVPEVAARLGRRTLRLGMRALYERVFHTQVTGRAYAPPTGGYIVAANHASHLDMGLVKHALGEQGELLVALAARDYFFDDPVRRAYFENFTNLVPMERYGSLRESLRLAGDVIRSGHILLIFPEGTRSVTGVMSDFKQSLGYLALHNRCGILPMYLAGTHDALPKGSYLPKNRDIAAHLGPFATYEGLVSMTRGASRAASYRAIADHIERVVRGLAPVEYEWTLGEAGRQALAHWQASQSQEPGIEPGASEEVAP